MPPGSSVPEHGRRDPAPRRRSGLPRALRSPRSSGRRCLEPSRQVRIRRAAQHPRRRLPRRGLRDQPAGRGGARHQARRARSTSSRTAPPTSSLCARPRRRNLELLRACAAKGVRAAFITSGGYAEAGADGEAAQVELVRTAASSGCSSPVRTVKASYPRPSGCARRSSRRIHRPVRSASRASRATSCRAS